MSQRIFVLALAAAAVVSAAELPVSRVVLYKNGLALYERTGEAKPGEPVKLEFKKSEMDDVLKTLVLASSAGTVARLRYQLDTPLDQRLAEIGLTIDAGTTLAELLDQLRGGRVTLVTAGAPAEGAIVAGRVSKVDVPKDGALSVQLGRQELTLLTSAGELRTVDLGSVASVKFADTALQRRFSEALTAYEQSQSTERKSLWVETTGKPGTLSARYLVAAPVWKSAYRLAFDAKQEATLEGWAIVENTSQSDWRNVELTVVSGRPISFVSSLYEPRYIARQRLDLPEEQAGVPQEYATQPPPPPPPVPAAGLTMTEQMGMASKNDRFTRSDGTHLGVGAAPALSMGKLPKSANGAFQRLERFAMLNTSSAEGQEVGELFEYRFKEPATVKAGESVMLPFVEQKIVARQLYVWSAATGLHPQRAVELKNSTQKTLDGGPVTLYASDGYAGETLMSTLKSGDKRTLTFAVDLGTRVTSKYGTGSQTVRSIKAERGVITTKTAIEDRTVYTISNVDARAKTLLISHPMRVGLGGTLIAPKPDEKTSDHYLFSVNAAAAATSTLTVVEERPIEESVQIGSLNADAVIVWLKGRKLTPEARAKVEAVAAKKREVETVESEVEARQKKVKALETDEERTRKNIQSLAAVAGQQEQVQRYASQLAKAETAIQDERAAIEQLNTKREQLNAELALLVEKLSF